ncbi:MAG TPA: DNA repair protein RadA [Patescibacteria group bacterium]|nr:DNA repair protein RadA [Patescibacteria group bacterium]
MAKDQIIFVCGNCGEEYLKWQGRCDNCGEWNTLKEMSRPKAVSRRGEAPAEIVELAGVQTKNFQRISTKITEFDRVLGGGIVPGTIMILGGDPGIGKSTLLLQLAGNLPNTLYISGEESLEQLKLRFDRLKLKSKSLKIFPEIDLEQIVGAIGKEKPPVAIIDSIQTVYSADFPSTPGSLVQVRECALRLQQLAKSSSSAIILVGHVTKEGNVAGPRTLEHLVDIVLYLEGERFHDQRILRGVKNRFGATSEIGIFKMTEYGLSEVINPSEVFLAERLKNVPGNVVTATIEGSRPLLVEVQALLVPTVFGYPQRRTSGFDLNRLQLLLAILQKRAGLNLASQDVFINIVGGIKIFEPAVDLAVALAVAGALKGKSLDWRLCAFGEIGLSGEIRRVSMESKRKDEAKRLGFEKFIQAKTIEESIRRYCV